MERAREIAARNDDWDLLAAMGEQIGLHYGTLIATYCDGKLVHRYWLTDEFKLRGVPAIEQALLDSEHPKALPESDCRQLGMI
jgi:hypothetical protein